MLRYLVMRDFDNVEVLLLPQKDGSGWTIVIRHKCPWCGYIGIIDSQGNLF